MSLARAGCAQLLLILQQTVEPFEGCAPKNERVSNSLRPIMPLMLFYGGGSGRGAPKGFVSFDCVFPLIGGLEPGGLVVFRRGFPIYPLSRGPDKDKKEKTRIQTTNPNRAT